MSIQKKSLISSLKTTKKANVASSELDAKPTSVNSKKAVVNNRKAVVNNRKASFASKTRVTSLKSVKADFIKY
jgi:hypothetical protein